MFGLIKNTTLRTRIIGGFGLVLLLFAAVTAVGIVEVNRVDGALIEINRVNSAKQRYAINFRGSVHDRAIELRDVVLFGNEAEVGHARATIERLAKFYAESAGPLDDLMKDNKTTIQQEHETLADIKNIEKKTLPLISEVISLRFVDSDRAQKILMEQARPLFIEWLGAINRFIDLQETKNRDATTIATGITSGFQGLMLWACAISFILGVGIAFWSVVSVRRLRRLTRVMQRLADGQLETEVPATNAKDEVGDITRTVEVFKTKALHARSLESEAEQQRVRADQEKRRMMAKLAEDFERSVKGVVNTVATSAVEMKSSSNTLGRSASDTSNRATAVAVAATQASSNVQSVAGATQQLTASIKEISSQVQTSARTAQGAVAIADHTNKKVEQLAEASQRIGEVVQLINIIASQTNLLALNASIEAAHAGEAGKGFAVVASEVKNLASQTAKATDDISAQIASMQTATTETVGAIRQISETIKELDHVAAAIASAVEQQGTATLEIARNVQEAARGTDDVTANIEAVSMAAGETGSAVNTLQGAANDLSREAEVLRHEVDNFLGKVRAA